MSAKILISLLLSVLIIYSEAKYGCPKINVFSRCSTWCRCTYAWNSADYTYKTVFKCNGFNGRIGELDDWLRKNLNGSDIDDFVFNNYKLERLPDSVFERTLINRIIISDSPLLRNFGYRGSGKTIFDGLGQTLETVVISNSPNIEIEDWANMVTSLSANSTNPPALKNLIFYRNSLTTITELAAFNGLTNLQKITWRAISLAAIDSPLDFTPFTKLRLLDLSENRLSTFDAKLPPSLTTIYLNGNRELTRFGAGFFTELSSSNVDYINVKDPNKLDCSCDKVDEITGTYLGTIFEGTCATPSQVRGKPYGTICFEPPNKIRKISSKLLEGL